MHFQHSIMVGILDRYTDRFTEYQPAVSLEERIAQAAGIEGATGVELVYPVDVQDLDRAKALLAGSGLALSAVNLNVKTDPVWRNGSFTNPDADVRRRAVDSLTAAMDLAAELGSGMVTVCPLMDGWDYSFQVDYVAQWRWLVDGIRAAASHRPDVRVSIEYKPTESRAYITVPDVGTTLHLADRVGLDNVGVTLDVGHALIAGETPAMSIAMAHAADRMFYVHFNDNNRAWDWDMVPGAVHLWDMVEALHYLDKLGWEGWFAYDIYTKHGSPVDAFRSTIGSMNSLQAILDKIGAERIEELIANEAPARATEILLEILAS
jgi:xylose isomerase